MSSCLDLPTTNLLPAGIGPVLMLDTDDMLVIGHVVEGLWRSTVPQLGLDRKAAVAHRNCRGHFYEGSFDHTHSLYDVGHGSDHRGQTTPSSRQSIVRASNFFRGMTPNPRSPRASARMTPVS